MRALPHLVWSTVTILAFFGGRSLAPTASSEQAVDRYRPVQEAHAATDAHSVRDAALTVLSDPRRRIDAAVTLAFVAGPDDGELLWRLAVDKDAFVAHHAVGAIGRALGEAALPRLIALSRDPDASTRTSAVEALGDIDHSDAIGTLRAGLSNPAINQAAAAGLARNGSSRAAAAVSAAFWTSNGWNTSAFATALTDFPVDSGARDTLWKAVEGERPPWFEEALDALAEADDPAVYATAMRLLDSPSTDTRVVAVDALEELEDRRAIPALLALLDRAEGTELSSVVSALLAFGGRDVEDELIARMETGPPEIAREIANWMFSTPTLEDAPIMVRIARARPGPIADNLTYTLFSHDWPPGRVPRSVLELAREQARTTREQSFTYVLDVLVRGGVPADLAMIEDLIYTGTRSQRTLAIDALDEDPSRERDALFLDLLDDADPTIVEAAIEALEGRGPDAQEALVDRLIRTLGRHPAGAAWGRAETVIARIGGERGRDALLRQVRDGTGDERDNAISALVGSDTAAHHQALYDQLERLDEDGRRRVLETSLASGNAPRAEVERALRDPDDEVVRAAADALARSDGAAAAPVLRSMLEDDTRDEHLRENLLSALVAAGPEDLESTLNELLDDPFLAESALSHLAQLGTDDAARTLRSIALDDADPELRASALSTLSWQGAIPDELGLFEAALDDEAEDVRSAAIDGMRSLGTTAAAERLLAIAQEDGEVAAAAASALETLGGRLATENAELLKDVQEAAENTPIDTGP
jgi:HEAT repeat protein